jgi:hypothetical protein
MDFTVDVNLMVEPLVICELSPSYPSVDVYAHVCWKWMLTYMFDHFDMQSGWKGCDLSTFCIGLLQWSKP